MVQRKGKDIDALLNAQLTRMGKKEAKKRTTEDPFEMVGKEEGKKVKLRAVKFKRKIEQSEEAQPAEQVPEPVPVPVPVPVPRPVPRPRPEAESQPPPEKKQQEKKRLMIDPAKLKNIRKVRKEESPEQPKEPLPLAPTFITKKKPKPEADLAAAPPIKEENYPYKPSVPLTRVGKREDIYEKMKEVKKEEPKEDDYEDDFDEYREEEEIASIQKAMKRENQAAKTYFRNQEENGTKTQSIAKFTKAIIIPNTKSLDHAAKIEQERRLEEIGSKVMLMEEGFDPVFELKPERKQDRYFKRLAKGRIKNMLSQTNDDAVTMEVQTEVFEYADATQCAPIDYARSFDAEKVHDPADVERFVERLLPLIETAMGQVVEEESESGKAKKAVVEVRGTIVASKEVQAQCNASGLTVVRTLIGKSDPSVVAVLYRGTSPDNKPVYSIILYSMMTQRIIGCCSGDRYEVTAFAMLPPDEKLVVTGNAEGELMLYSVPKPGAVYTSYYGHKARIVSLSVRSSATSRQSALIASIDAESAVCFWRVDAVTSGTDITPSLNEIVLGDYKLQLLECTDLSLVSPLSASVPVAIDIDPKDTNSYLILTEEGIVKNSRILSTEETARSFEFKEMLFTRPTAISISDEGLFLVGYENGSISIYSQHYTIPLTVWQEACEGAVAQLKWSSVYFESIGKEHLTYTKDKSGDASKLDFPSNYKTNLAEFYVIDSRCGFQIWNLNKSVNKPVYSCDLGKLCEASSKSQPVCYSISDTVFNKWIYVAVGYESEVSVLMFNLSKVPLADYAKLMKFNIRSKKIIASLPNGWDMPDPDL